MDDIKPVAQSTPPPAEQPASLPEPQLTGAIEPPRHNKKKFWLIGGLAALLVLVGGGYGAYAYVTNTPGYLLKSATDHMANQKVLASKFKLTVGTDDTGINFSGDFATRTDENNQNNGEFVVGFGTGSNRISTTVRVIDQSLYLKAGSLQNLPNLITTFMPSAAGVYDTPEFTSALQRVSDQWFFISKEELEQMNEGAGEGISPTITAEDTKKIKTIYDKHSFIVPGKTFADEQVDGVTSAHFEVTVDQAKFDAFIDELKNAGIQSVKLTDQDVADAKKAVAEVKAKAAFEVWIARDSKRLTQVKLTSTDSETQGSLVVTMVTDLPQFEPLAKPADAKPFSEFMTTLLGPEATMPVLDPNLEEGDMYYDDYPLEGTTN